MARRLRGFAGIVAAMSMSISVAPSSSVPDLAYPASSTSPVTTVAASAIAAKAAAQQFQEYASMTPAQRLHAQMFAKLGLTEDQFEVAHD
jgi:hypothetical protein